MRHILRLFLILAALLAGVLGVRAADVVLVAIDRMPNAWGLTHVPGLVPDGQASMALLVSRTAQNPREQVAGGGYLTINTGRLSAVECSFGHMLRDGRRLDLSVFAQQGSNKIPKSLGWLGEALHADGFRTGAIGSPEALGMIMDHNGAADVVDVRVLRPTPADLARAQACIASVDVAVVDASKMTWIDAGAALGWLHRLVESLPHRTRILVCCPNPPSSDLHELWPPTWAVLLHAPTGATALYSPSTRRVGLIVNTDLASSVLAWLGCTEQVGIGQACASRGRVTAVELLRTDTALLLRAQWRLPLFLRYVGILTGMMALLALALLGGQWGQYRRWRRGIYFLATLIAASWLPFTLTGLLPTSYAALAVELGIGLLLALLIAQACPQYRIFAFWIFSALIMVLCLHLAPNWILYNQLSYVVLKDSRYYGLGNTAAGVVVAGMLAFMVLAYEARRCWLRMLALLLPWLVAGWFFWGGGAANFGMGITAAVLPATMMVMMARPEARVKWFFICAGATIVLLGGLIWLDIASGAPTHVGRLALDIGQYGPMPLLYAIARKLRTVWLVLRISSFTYLEMASLLALAMALRAYRPWWQTNRRAVMLLGIGAASILAAFCINDSGIEPTGILTVCLITCFIELECIDQQQATAPAEEAPIRAEAG